MKLGVYTAVPHDRCTRTSADDLGPQMAANIEHEDVELGRLERLEVAATTLQAASELAAQPV